MEFFERIRSCASALAALLEQKNSARVRLVGTLSADGIAACALFSLYLRRRECPFSVTFVRSLTDVLFEELRDCPENIVVFCDLGTGRLSKVSTLVPAKVVFVFDHHLPVSDEHADFYYLNPCCFGVDGTREISTSGIIYFLLKELGISAEYNAILALVGAVGDAQERGQFLGYNKILLEECGSSLRVFEGLTLFGAYTRPLVDVIEQSLNPFIPGVTGNRDSALRFLERNGITAFSGKKPRWLHQLSRAEVEQLLSALAPRLRGGREALLGSVYLFRDPVEQKPTDIRELSALLNACSRAGHGAVGFGACLGDEHSCALARPLVESSHRSLLNALVWFYANKGKDRVQEHGSYVMINAEGYISDHLLGTVLSLLSRSGLYPDGTILVALAYTLNGDLHMSARVCGSLRSLDLRALLERVVALVGGDVGGHALAAGAHVRADKEEDLLRAIRDVFAEVIPSSVAST